MHARAAGRGRIRPPAASGPIRRGDPDPRPRDDGPAARGRGGAPARGSEARVLSAIALYGSSS